MSLFSSSVARNLVNLRVLIIKDCDEMVRVIKDDEEEEKENMVSGGKRTVVVFPKLEELQLMQIPKLVTFCEWKSCDVQLPSLRKVKIKNCHDIKNWSLGLLAAPNLEVFKTDNNYLEVVGVNVIFDSLKILSIKGNELPLYHYKGLISLFNRLGELYVSGYGGSMSLFSPSITRNLVNLRVLWIQKCYEMEKVIEDVEEEIVVSGGDERTDALFPKLEKLVLRRLPKLVRFCEWKCDVELPSLWELFISDCPNMKKFSLGPLTTPNLEFVEIDYKDCDDDDDPSEDLNDLLQRYFQTREEEEEEEEEEEDAEAYNVDHSSTI